MLGEALSWYLEGLTAFWSGMARGGLVQLILIGLILWWIFGRRGRCCGACPRCGCWCGHCRCREVDGSGGSTAEHAEGGGEGSEEDESG